MVNSGSQLVDALVAHMSHKTKEGFGRQRLWFPLSLSDSLSLFLSLTQVDIIRRAGGFGELVLRTLLRSPVGAYDKDALGGKEEKR